MAEYYAVLRKAVAGLGPNSGVAEARRVVYDKARNALIGQLKAVEPPLTTAEISRQRLELEEAIRKVERESMAAASAPPQSRPAPARGDTMPPRVTTRAEPPPPAEPEPAEAGPSPQEVFRRAIQDAEHRGTVAGSTQARSAPSQRSDPRPASGGDREHRPYDRMERVAQPPPEEDEYQAPEPEPDYGRAEQRRQQGPEPRLAPEYDQEWEAPAAPAREPSRGDYEPQERPRPRSAIRTRGFSDEENPEPYDRERPARRRSRAGLIVPLLTILILGAVGAVAWSQRAVISDLLASFDDRTPPPAETPPAAPETAAAEPTGPASSAKDADRLLPGEPPPARTVRTVEPADPAASPADDGTEPIPGETDTSAVDAGEDTAATPVTPDAPGGDDVLVAQKAILYEEPIGGATSATSVTAIDAAVTWRFVPNGTNGPEIEGTLQVPERSMKVKFAVRKNSDTTLPASHLVEVVIDTPADFPGRGIRSVPRIVMKPTEEARGQPLVGASAKVADGFFWVALSAAEADVASNLELLRDRDWIDLPFIYDTGQRAILTFEKGIPGERVFEQAIEAWGGAPSATATPG